MKMWPFDRKMCNSRYQDANAANPISDQQFIDD